MSVEKVCKQCTYFEEENGFCFCWIKELYTQANPEEEACYSYVERT